MINKLPAKQILVVADICHGGLFDVNLLGAREKGDDEDRRFLNESDLVKLSRYSKYKTRILLSSVGDGNANDGRDHSPFAKLFLKCLRNNEGSLLSATDIIATLRKPGQYADDENNKIEPYKGHFGDNKGMGEFVFIPKEPKVLAGGGTKN